MSLYSENSVFDSHLSLKQGKMWPKYTIIRDLYINRLGLHGWCCYVFQSGNLGRQPQMRIKLLQQLVEMGFKVDHIVLSSRCFCYNHFCIHMTGTLTSHNRIQNEQQTSKLLPVYDMFSILSNVDISNWSFQFASSIYHRETEGAFRRVALWVLNS